VVLGRDVTLVSRPLPVHLVAWPGATIEIGDSVVLEAGCTIVAKGRVVIGDGARLGACCVLMDSGESSVEKPGIQIGKGAILEADTMVLDGAVVEDGARIARGTTIGGSTTFEPPGPPARVGPDGELSAKLRSVVASIVRAIEHVGFDDDWKYVEGWDSVAAIHVIVAVEDAFGVTLPSNFLSNSRTLRALNDAVATQLAKGARSEG
jgi:acyl carrier protein